MSLQRLFIYHQPDELTARKEDFLAKQATLLFPTFFDLIMTIWGRKIPVSKPVL
jgi:hypothetical protein